MAKRDLWVSNRDQTLAGRNVSKGQLIAPAGAQHDRLIFRDDSRWAYRFQGGQTYICGTDGCTAEFESDTMLFRHRDLVHKPERDAREKARLEHIESAKRAEENGDTIGGHEIVMTKSGPRGPVDYIAPPGT